MITRTAQYALRAMVAIAEKGEGASALASEISRQARVPRPYLSAILRTAVRARLLKSTRGRGGGFSLARSADRMTLAEILAPFDQSLTAQRCPFGLERCSDAQPCPVHDYWRPISSGFRRMLESTTLSKLSDGSATANRRHTSVRKKGRKKGSQRS
ncbi:MAG: hypothetical protein DCC65_12250 [Planctomycetota bacterium]|nr:MAG: hypothetical protein DCC65_12250 [Planctomycetota bacterium]